MSTKSEYPQADWEALKSAAGAAGMLVIASDRGGLFAEIAALLRIFRDVPVPEAARPLVGSLMLDMQDAGSGSAAMLPDTDREDADEAKEQLYDVLRKADWALKTIAEEEEAAAFRSWIAAVARRVAESGREGGFLGVGGQLVSDAEEAALGRIAEAIGLGGAESDGASASGQGDPS